MTFGAEMVKQGSASIDIEVVSATSAYGTGDLVAIPYPTGLVSGETLLVIAWGRRGDGWTAAPGSWAELFDLAGNGASFTAAWLESDGTETGTADFVRLGGGPEDTMGMMFHLRGNHIIGTTADRFDWDTTQIVHTDATHDNPNAPTPTELNSLYLPCWWTDGASTFSSITAGFTLVEALADTGEMRCFSYKNVAGSYPDSTLTYAASEVGDSLGGVSVRPPH